MGRVGRHAGGDAVRYCLRHPRVFRAGRRVCKHGRDGRDTRGRRARAGGLAGRPDRGADFRPLRAGRRGALRAAHRTAGRARPGAPGNHRPAGADRAAGRRAATPVRGDRRGALDQIHPLSGGHRLPLRGRAAHRRRASPEIFRLSFPLLAAAGIVVPRVVGLAEPAHRAGHHGADARRAAHYPQAARADPGPVWRHLQPISCWPPSSPRCGISTAIRC